ncbi:MAG: CAP domain-containing protein [Epsilonproteobacteria bacterium]|nr:CAP domain-containing protein [Campylobacterota bacterium]
MRIFLFSALLLNWLYSFDTLQYLNKLRVNAGSSKLYFDSALAKAAKKHAIYLAKNREFGHFENPYKPFFFAKSPWQRITKAGFATKAVVENISFYERSYKESIDKIMATIYHRLAFLDTKIDSIGFAKYNRVYVYDMSNSKLARLCKKEYEYSSEVVENICKNRRAIPKSIFNKALIDTKRRSNLLIIYPYPNQKNLPLRLQKESPAFSSKEYGLPISVCFNSFSRIKLTKLALYKNNKRVRGKIVTFRNDRNRKIPKNCFIFLPYKKLQSSSLYKVFLRAKVGSKNIAKEWSFSTY